jgi:hypothetical protein
MIVICELCGKQLDPVQTWSKAKYCSKAHAAQHREELKKKAAGAAQQVWACGCGTQSTAIAALIVTGKLPKPDLAWFVDVGYEKQSTHRYLDSHLMPTMAKVGVQINVLKSSEYVSSDLFDEQGYCRLPLYRMHEGARQKFDARCSNLWKRVVAFRWLKAQGVERCDTWLGISTDEIKRARKSMTWWNQNRYPLVELGIDRGRCLWLIGKLGWPEPPRTSCYFCPGNNDHSWISLKHNAPDDFARACETEDLIHERRADMFLHESCVPLRDVTFRNEDRLQMECFGSDASCWSG